jgi:ribosomal protein S8
MGTTISDIVISYDIDKLHIEVKAEMVKKGYMTSWKSYDGSRSNPLPNTTLWCQNKSTNQAVADLKQVCSSLGVTLEKVVAVKADEFVGL